MTPSPQLLTAARHIARAARWVKERKAYEIRPEDMYALLDGVAAETRTEDDTEGA